MTRVVISLYERPRVADKVMRALYDAGFDSAQIDCVEGAPRGPTLFRRGLQAHGKAEVIDAEKAHERLAELGVPRDEIGHFLAQIRGGRSMVLVRSDEEISGRARHLMSRYPAAETEEASTLSGNPEPASTTLSAPASRESQELLERIDDADEDQARRALSHRQRQGGEVEGELHTSHAAERFRVYEPEFRRHFEEHYAPLKRYDFEEYSRAYRYGLALAEDSAFQRHTWATVEPQARRRWRGKTNLEWAEFREAVRFGWYRIRGEEERYGAPPHHL